MYYNELMNLAPYSSILKYKPEQDTFFYLAVSKGVEEFYNIPSKEFINKPLYFSISEIKNRDIDIERCHDTFKNLIFNSLNYGSS